MISLDKLHICTMVHQKDNYHGLSFKLHFALGNHILMMNVKISQCKERKEFYIVKRFMEWAAFIICWIGVTENNHRLAKIDGD